MTGFDRRWFLLRGAQAAGVAAAAPTAVGIVARLLDDVSLVDLGGARLAGNTPSPPILTRSQWGADESKRSGTPEYAPLTKLFIHHTATPNDPPDPAATVRAIYKHHVEARDFQDIGYHFLIAPDGRIYEGRWSRAHPPGQGPTGTNDAGEIVQGAHVAVSSGPLAGGYNRGTMGVALLGNFTSSLPTAAALEALVQILAWVCDRHRLDPFDVSAYVNSRNVAVNLPTIVGHRDVDSTGCPGDAFHPMLQTIRERVAQTIGNGFIGYRLIAANGEAAHFGGARDYGDLRHVGVSTRVVGAAGAPDAQGYWMVDRSGAVYSFGAAGFFGSVPGLRQEGRRIGSAPVIGIAPSASGRGYWLYDDVGGIFAFGDAAFHGSVPALREQGVAVGPGNIVTMVATPTGGGYWVVDEFGGVFAFGDAGWFGSVPDLRNQGRQIGPARIVSMDTTPSGRGYWLLDVSGGIFAFGDAGFHGSIPSLRISDPPARRIVASPSGGGYVATTRSGAVYAFGDAPFHGRWVTGLDVVDMAPVIRQK